MPNDFGSLVRELHRLASEKRQPVNGTFELTKRCNLACRMCYVCKSPDDSILLASELSEKQWLEIARQAVDKGMVFLLLTGGEPLLRPDFFEIYTPLTRMGLILTLFTNGTLITESIASRLAEAPPSRTEITLYGASKETYEAVTGVPGSYERCCAGIEALVKRKVPLGLKTTITQINVHELEVMRSMAHDWDLPFSAGWLLTKRRDSLSSDIIDCRLHAHECVELEKNDRVSATDWIEAAMRDAGGSNAENFYCHAGQAAFVISPSGQMNVCIDLPLPAACPLGIGFQAAWEAVQQFVDSSPPMAKVCLECEARVFCPRCPVWSELETGTLTEPVPYLCEIAFARKELYGKDK